MEIDNVDIPEVKEDVVPVLLVEPKKKRSKVTLTATIEKNYLEFSRLFADFSFKIDSLCAKTCELDARTDTIYRQLQEICKLDRVHCKIFEIETPET